MITLQEAQLERLIEVLVRIHSDLHKDLLRLSSDLNELSLVTSHVT